MLPKVLVGGFPGSGTSFLCWLVSELGFSAGSRENLKLGGTTHNRWGHWEYLPIQRETRACPGNTFRVIPASELPLKPLRVPDKIGKRIREIAERDNVEVYKDNMLPLVFRLFSKDANYIIIKRDVPKLMKGVGRLGYRCTQKELKAAWDRYHRLVSILNRDRHCMNIWYEDFHKDFEATVGGVCAFLGVDIRRGDVKRLRGLWRPRERWEFAAEPDVAKFLLEYLKPDMTFVDIGAEKGTYTHLAAKRVERVIAFEPNHRYYHILLNDTEKYSNVTIVKKAVFSKTTMGYITTAGREFRWPVFMPRKNGNMEATTLDEYLRGQRVDVIKIDIEGGEYHALRGMIDTLKRHSPALVIEVHFMLEYYGHSVADIEKFFVKLGYKWRPLSFAGGLGQAVADEKKNQRFRVHIAVQRD